MLREIAVGRVQHLLILRLENLGEDVRIEQSFIQALRQVAGEIGAGLGDSISFLDLFVGQPFVHLGPILDRLRPAKASLRMPTRQSR